MIVYYKKTYYEIPCWPENLGGRVLGLCGDFKIFLILWLLSHQGESNKGKLKNLHF